MTPSRFQARDSRGFPVVKVCSECKEQIQQGKPVTVTYKGHEVQVNADKGGGQRERVISRDAGTRQSSNTQGHRIEST